MFCVSFGALGFFYVLVDSALEVDSVLLSRVGPRSSWTSVMVCACWFCWLWCTSRCVLFDWLQA